MEKKYKIRFNFAMSSFARMYGPRGITLKMSNLCKIWAKNDNEPPTGSLTQVDFYFRDILYSN
jgi:hypothetical protein|tara:strand:+ start:311 stop:499 length:189 start_codon:yes stop_codon:yes gene_type:complete